MKFYSQEVASWRYWSLPEDDENGLRDILQNFVSYLIIISYFIICHSSLNLFLAKLLTEELSFTIHYLFKWKKLLMIVHDSLCSNMCDSWNYHQYSILKLYAWLPSLWTGVRLRLTLLWYKPCCFFKCKLLCWHAY